ncbi:glycoside hydrolase family 3 N-terminal domain-containing protein [Corynebacterium auriscanis]|uniref:glycoside hydrolase family 3 N-terminal domain-containing protein n=1 Tax=Corynebacterium auriscanis TaxID=99807 RepID=UPI002245C582|nr:glycoside hydrolase family 3 N-terminal domain-containing protein [Corynebacterium auriscanis]MCX2163880.1 glycoside hydrolase family 3 protein [Corynebacterium auriscanis]
MRRILVVVSASALLLAGCSTDSGPTPPAADSAQNRPSSSTLADSSTVSAPADKNSGDAGDANRAGRPAGMKCESLRDATDRQLAGRLMAVGITDFASAQQAVDAGVRHLFVGTGSDYSILNGQGDPARSIAALEKRAGEKLTISVDEEGGEVQRLSGIVGKLPSPREMAATMTPQQVRAMMAEHGRKLRALGVTVDFAPVLDLGGAQDISANGIGSRAFSADPRVVATYGRAYAEGLRDAGIVPVFKHFPGHGHVKGDSHLGTVVSPPLSVMENQDLLPFRQLATMGTESVGDRPAPAGASAPGRAGQPGSGRAGQPAPSSAGDSSRETAGQSRPAEPVRPAPAMMIGHMQVPGLGDKKPASINPAAYKLLRSYKFNGLIVTDDLTGMKAVSDQLSGPDAVVAAVSAGADQALAAAGGIDVPAAVEALSQAISSGKIPRDRAIASADRGCVLY